MNLIKVDEKSLKKIFCQQIVLIIFLDIIKCQLNRNFCSDFLIENSITTSVSTFNQLWITSEYLSNQDRKKLLFITYQSLWLKKDGTPNKIETLQSLECSDFGKFQLVCNYEIENLRIKHLIYDGEFVYIFLLNVQNFTWRFIVIRLLNGKLILFNSFTNCKKFLSNSIYFYEKFSCIINEFVDLNEVNSFLVMNLNLNKNVHLSSFELWCFLKNKTISKIRFNNKLNDFKIVSLSLNFNLDGKLANIFISEYDFLHLNLTLNSIINLRNNYLNDELTKQKNEIKQKYLNYIKNSNFNELSEKKVKKNLKNDLNDLDKNMSEDDFNKNIYVFDIKKSNLRKKKMNTNLNKNKENLIKKKLKKTIDLDENKMKNYLKEKNLSKLKRFSKRKKKHKKRKKKLSFDKISLENEDFSLSNVKILFNNETVLINKKLNKIIKELLNNSLRSLEDKLNNKLVYNLNYDSKINIKKRKKRFNKNNEEFNDKSLKPYNYNVYHPFELIDNNFETDSNLRFIKQNSKKAINFQLTKLLYDFSNYLRSFNLTFDSALDKLKKFKSLTIDKIFNYRHDKVIIFHKYFATFHKVESNYFIESNYLPIIQPNQIYLGCPQPFCFLSTFDDLTYNELTNELLIFRNQFYWIIPIKPNSKYLKIKFPKYKEARLINSKEDFPEDFPSYLDAITFVNFNNMNYLIAIKEIWVYVYIPLEKKLIPLLLVDYFDERMPTKKIDTILYHSKQLFVFSDSNYWIYDLIDHVKLRFNNKGVIFKNLASNLDASFTFNNKFYFFKQNYFYLNDQNGNSLIKPQLTKSSFFLDCNQIKLPKEINFTQLFQLSPIINIYCVNCKGYMFDNLKERFNIYNKDYSINNLTNLDHTIDEYNFLNTISDEIKDETSLITSNDLKLNNDLIINQINDKHQNDLKYKNSSFKTIDQVDEFVLNIYTFFTHHLLFGSFLLIIIFLLIYLCQETKKKFNSFDSEQMKNKGKLRRQAMIRRNRRWN